MMDKYLFTSLSIYINTSLYISVLYTVKINSLNFHKLISPLPTVLLTVNNDKRARMRIDSKKELGLFPLQTLSIRYGQIYYG